MANKSVDYAVVGGGLAGCCLTLQLIRQGYRVALYDQPASNRSSVIAAGLFNPITNQVMNKTWRADEIFDSVHSFYPWAEALLGTRFFYPMPLYRPFGGIEEQNDWMGKSSSPGMAKFIEHLSPEPQHSSFVNDPFGGIELRHCGYVNVRTFLASVRNYLAEEHLYFEREVSVRQWQPGSGMQLEVQSPVVIFCQGTAARENPLFNWLPINALKGETLEITMNTWPDRLFNKGVYVVPSGSAYKVGATYQRNGVPGISEEGRKELTEKLSSLVRVPYEITGQDWGYRPTIIDRRPVMGSHPEFPSLMIFNGLGTKGVSLAPHFSGVLARHITDTSQIEQEVNITRFYTLYSKF